MITAEIIQEVMANIWTTMFDQEVGTLPEPPPKAAENMTSVVHISGAWEGAVIIEVPSTLSVKLASAMLGMTEEELGPDEVRDAIGELANVAGGNIKSLLPQPSSLSLPTVVEGSGYRIGVVASVTTLHVYFHSHGEALSVTVVHRR